LKNCQPCRSLATDPACENRDDLTKERGISPLSFVREFLDLRIANEITYTFQKPNIARRAKPAELYLVFI